MPRNRVLNRSFLLLFAALVLPGAALAAFAGHLALALRMEDATPR